MFGRVDIDPYKAALKTCVNSVPMVQGPIDRRPGTVFVSEVKDHNAKTRLIRFEFSTTQAYIIEFGNLYCRFYRDHAQIVSGPPVEIATPYTTADIFDLKFTQSNDVLYVAHPTYAPRKITRTSHTAWSISTISFLDGPYLPTNTTATTMTPSATTGSVTVTASAATFAATDVGRAIRIQHSSTWGWGTITAFTSTTQVTVNVISAFGGTTAVTTWRLGSWSATTGYPSCVTFYEDRLCWAGATPTPQRVDMSKTGDYENMAPTKTDGTVAADNAVAITLNSDDVQIIRWIIGEEKGLLVGTVKAEWVVRPSNQQEALTPTNVSAKQATSYGSANIQCTRAGKAVLFVHRARRKLREMAYVYEVDGFRAPDMTIFAEHVSRGGLIELAYQQEPQSILWAVRTDGTLLGFTYERDQKVLAWHRHVIGGAFGSGQAVVESVAVIPAPDGTRDELWMIVKRTIGGVTKRYVEYMQKPYEDGDTQSSAWYVDCGLAYSGAPATTITGLSHLEGQVVTILADGAAHPTKTVSGGQITLDRSASVVNVGFGYFSDGETLRFEAGAADGTAQGKTQRFHRVTFRLHNALGLKTGSKFTDLTEVTFRDTADDLGVAVPLFSGDLRESWDGDYADEANICWRWHQPLPGKILALMPQLHTQDA